MDLIIRELSKQYPNGVWGLRDFSLHLQPGVLGLVGPNGAGKTTLLRILATVMKPTEGTVIYNRFDAIRHPNRLRPLLGYLPQEFDVYPQLTGREFLQYLAALKGVWGKKGEQKIDALLTLVGLNDVKHRHARSYSTGMKQRLGIAQALINDPQLLVVDEPTTGLDPEERVRFRNLLSQMAEERIVILSTHIVADVEATATQVAFIARGQLMMLSSPDDLVATMRGKVWTLTVNNSVFADLRDHYKISALVRKGQDIQVRVLCAEPPAPEAYAVEPTLEDAYMFHIGTSDMQRSDGASNV